MHPKDDARVATMRQTYYQVVLRKKCGAMNFLKKWSFNETRIICYSPDRIRINPKKRRASHILRQALLGLVFGLSACNSVDQHWVPITGTVKSVQGINDEGTPATTASKVLFNRISFEYKFENKAYENSQIVGLNVPMKFEQGRPIQLKVNKEHPSMVRIDLPPEPPDRTGMTLRRGLYHQTTSDQRN